MGPPPVQLAGDPPPRATSGTSSTSPCVNSDLTSSLDSTDSLDASALRISDEPPSTPRAPPPAPFARPERLLAGELPEAGIVVRATPGDPPVQRPFDPTDERARSGCDEAEPGVKKRVAAGRIVGGMLGGSLDIRGWPDTATSCILDHDPKPAGYHRSGRVRRPIAKVQVQDERFDP